MLPITAMPRPRTSATPEGVLLVDKPAGMTSHDVVTLARRALKVRRIGHTGTLDPFATGLLVLLVGQATRLAQFVEDEPKVYETLIEFGSETTTDDVTGSVVRTAELPAPAAVDSAIQSLTGPIRQLPPDYSAKKVAGRRAYAAARAGSPLVLEPVPVVVHDWSIRHRAPSTLDAVITCGGGTYIRALARDLGRAAGSAAHLTALRRMRSGVFDVQDAVTLDDVRAGLVRPARTSSAIPHMTTQCLGDLDVRRIRHGQPIDATVDAELVALVDEEGGLVALARRDGDLLRPNVVMHDEI
jgi:tRNA pseudouridine55 synthase